MSYKYSFCALFALSLISTLQAMELGGQVLVPERLGQLALIHHDNRFYVDHEGKTKQVQNCFVDKELRGLSSEKLEKFLIDGNGYLSLSQMSDGEYSIHGHTRGLGGGPAGATAGFYIGKFLTHFVGHGTLFLVACCTGPAFPVTLASLEATFSVPIEGASNVVGLGTGVIGAVVTGPA